MGSPQAAEVVAFHGTGKTLTNRSTGYVDFLARNEVLSRQLCTNVDHVVFRYPEFGQFAFWLNLGNRVVATHRLGYVFHFRLAGSELHGCVAVFLIRPLGNDLNILHTENCHRNIDTRICVDACHPNLLCNHA